MSMLYAIHCLDKEGAEPLRAQHAPSHAAYMRSHAPAIVFGGPLLAGDGGQRIGVLVIVEFDDRQALDAFIANEPYKRAGLFRQVDVRPYEIVMNRFSSRG